MPQHEMSTLPKAILISACWVLLYVSYPTPSNTHKHQHQHQHSTGERIFSVVADLGRRIPLIFSHIIWEHVLLLCQVNTRCSAWIWYRSEYMGWFVFWTSEHSFERRPDALHRDAQYRFSDEWIERKREMIWNMGKGCGCYVWCMATKIRKISNRTRIFFWVQSRQTKSYADALSYISHIFGSQIRAQDGRFVCVSTS